MNLTLHIVRTDLRRMRVWLICWLGMLLAPLVLVGTLLVQTPSAGSWTAPRTFTILTVAQFVVGYLLTILLLHEHRLIGSTQFWLTRPISRGRLLQAKALGAFIVVALMPVAASLPWWLWCGFGGAEIFNASLEIVAVMFAVIVCGAAMAALTDSLGRALLWTVVFVGGGLFAMFFFSFVNASQLPTSVQSSLVLTRSVFAIVAVLVELIVIVIVQYYLRRYGWWLGVAAAVIVATLLVALDLQTSWFDPPEPPQFNTSLANGVTVRIEGARVMSDRRTNAPDRPIYDQPIAIGGTLSGVAPQFTVRGVGGRHRWTSPDGLTIDRSLLSGRIDIVRYSSLGALSQDFEPVTVDGIPFSARVLLPRSIVARLGTEPFTYEARLWFRLGRMQRWYEMPLAARDWTQYGVRRVKILRNWGADDNMGVDFVETSPYPLSASITGLSRFNTWGMPIVSFPQFFLFDHERHEVGWLQGIRSRHAIVNGVLVFWHSGGVTRPGRQAGRSPVPAGWTRRVPAWLESSNTGTTFGAAAWHTEAQFARDVKAERFEIAK